MFLSHSWRNDTSSGSCWILYGFKSKRKVELQIILCTGFPGQFVLTPVSTHCLAWDLGTVRQDAEPVFFFFFAFMAALDTVICVCLHLSSLEKGVFLTFNGSVVEFYLVNG